MRVDLIAYLLPALLIGLALPMALGALPPNKWYGFRTPKTLSSPDIWYPANRACGWFLFAAGELALCCNLAIWGAYRGPRADLAAWMAFATVAWALLAVVASFVYLRRL